MHTIHEIAQKAVESVLTAEKHAYLLRELNACECESRLKSELETYMSIKRNRHILAGYG